MANEPIRPEGRQAWLTARKQCKRPALANLNAAVLASAFFSLLLSPQAAGANERSEFPSSISICSQPDCVCPPPRYQDGLPILCVRPLHNHDHGPVQFKVMLDSGQKYKDYLNVRQGDNQWEVGNGQTTKVIRARDGATSFAMQHCERTFTGGSNCSPWVDFQLQEPSVAQLDFCQDYADKAAAAEKQNVTLNCGYTGPRWTTDPKDNFNACAGSPAADLWPNETAARAQQLQDCKNQKTAEAKPKDFNGSWSITTDKGGAFSLVMTQQGAVVTGQLINSNPQYSRTLTGTMEADGKVAFKFVQPGVPASGEGRFWLEGDTDHLDARFTLNNSNGAVHLFSGKRM